MVVGTDLALPTTKGGIIAYSTEPTELAVGSNDTLLTADSTEATGLKWVSAGATASGTSLDYKFLTADAVSGSWNLTWDTRDFYYGGWYWSAGANGNYCEYEHYLSAGTYTLFVVGINKNNSGILDVYIDASEVASFDTYNASETFNAVDTQTGINVATSGMKTIKFICDGKNGSSSGYNLQLSGYQLHRTA